LKLRESQHFFGAAGDIFDLLHQAGKAIRNIYGSTDMQIYKKSDNSPVTEADILSNKIISSGLIAMFEELPILSEEADIPHYDIRKSWDYVWILDPLDGTKGFINKTDEFTINLGLALYGIVVAGCIYAPVSQQMYFASKGLGAYHYQKSGAHSKLTVNRFGINNPGLKVLASRHHRDARTQEHIDLLDTPVVIERGAALKFVSIAQGEADYYPKMSQIMEWDTAAGQILIEEAGGMMVQVKDGQPLKYNKPDLHSPHFIASGKIL
jgi:3'(2'), 5'-bisphosphate nucleotidase